MKNASGDVIYVGKAKNLRNRLNSYFYRESDTVKTRVLVSNVAGIDVIVTDSEIEALLLEQTLIKKHRPRYNVSLRDDKSYPYIGLSDHPHFPRFFYHRGAKKRGLKYFGPYPSAGSVRKTLQFIQKVFQVRQCEDAYFRNRSRPCLQYQIKRCTGPCVGLINEQDYQHDIDMSVSLLTGKNQGVISQLVDEMNEAAESLDYEKAAKVRDQIATLKRVTEKQYVSGHKGNTDVIASYLGGGQACVHVFLIRNGINLGGKAFYPKVPENVISSEVLYAFVTQFYAHNEVPEEILTSEPLLEKSLIEEVLSKRASVPVTIKHRTRGERTRWLEMAEENARMSLETRLSSRSGIAQRLDALRRLLKKEEIPERLECFDISHTMGEGTVASCVVFNLEGPAKQEYRRFNIEGITKGDDYAAMQQALERRYLRQLKESAPLPDIILIDGGKGQLNVAQGVMDDLQIEAVELVGVAKGPERKAGEELLIFDRGKKEMRLQSDSEALHLIQQIRDEAHRFAITGHRARRAKARNQSPLEQIPGVGAKRRQKLLAHFGGFQQIEKAGREELATVPGISKQLAATIYDELHRLKN
ncbi:MAG: excinuclease ABC subunit UvrC [Gammaproteobacteria bacterium]|nr:excinuclease ABC subunit UvrC [Gammaproteobacteria bacterium]